MEKLAAIILLSLSSFSFNSEAAEIQNYKVEQDSIKTVIAPTSGLEKASCVFLDEKGKQVAGQNVTIVVRYDNIAIVEANLNYDQHVVVSKVICMK